MKEITEMVTTETATSRLVGPEARVAVSTDQFGLVVEGQDIEPRVLETFTRTALNDSPAKASPSVPAWEVKRDGDRLTVRFSTIAADHLDNSEQWMVYRVLRDILMGRVGKRYSVAQRIESWLNFRTPVAIQEVPLGSVIVA